MKNRIEISAEIGGTFHKTAKHAQSIATDQMDVWFDFNGIKCTVSTTTDLSLLYRDYSNAHLMGWGQVGPDCAYHYSSDVLFEMAEKTRQQEIKREQERKEAKEAEEKKIAEFNAKTSGIVFSVINSEGFENLRGNNKDDYGNAIIEYAINWGKLMQFYIGTGETIESCAEKSSLESDLEGITGFMYGQAIRILSTFWEHGQELRNWHNKKYNYNGEGTVNPAVMTIAAK